MNNNFFNKSIEPNNIKKSKTNIPSIIFDNAELKTKVGEWLGLLPNDFELEEQKQNLVEKHFGILMKKIGINAHEICYLNQYDKNDFSFNCHLVNLNENLRIALEFGNSIDSFNTLTTFNGNYSKTYNIYKINSRKDSMISLASKKILNENNNNILTQYIMFSSFFTTITNNDYKLTINVVSNKEYDEYFQLENEEELQKYLLSINFPLNIPITELLKNIFDITKLNLTECAKINIKLEIGNRKNKKITNQIKIINSQNPIITIINNDKTISYTENGEWNYQDNETYISKNKTGTIDYKASNNAGSQNYQVTQIKKATEEVEKIKQYIKVNY